MGKPYGKKREVYTQIASAMEQNKRIHTPFSSMKNRGICSLNNFLSAVVMREELNVVEIYTNRRLNGTKI